jgi:hypothetical protein
MPNHNPRIKNYNSANVMVIFEGLGGSGKAFVLAFLKLYLAWLLTVEAWIKFSVLDIDPEAEDELGEFFYDEGDCPTHRFIAELEKHPAKYPGLELLGDLGQLRKAAGASNKLGKGAQTKPQLGELGLLRQIWRHPAKFLNFLTRPIFALKSVTSIAGFGTGDGPNARHGGGRPRAGKRLPPVVLVQSGSVCGGVGAGQLLYMADLRHFVCLNKWGVTEYEHNCDLFLPEIFNHDDERLKENTWDTMLKIESRYDGRRHFPLRLGTITLDRLMPPWREVTLWNRMTDKEAIYSGRDEVVQVMTEVNRMKYFGPIGERYQSELVNYASYPPGCFCSAAGGWRLIIEDDALKELGSFRLGKRLITDHLLRRLPEEQAEQQVRAEVDDFCHRMGLYHLSRCFDRDRQGRPLRESLERFRGERRRELPGKISDFEHKYFAAAGKACEEVRSQKARELGRALVQEIQHLLNAPSGGLFQAIRFLDGLALVVEEQQQRARTQLERKRAELAERQQQAQTKRRWLQWPLKTPRDDYLSKSQAIFESNDRLMKLTSTQELLSDLANVILERRRVLQGWVKVLEHLHAELDRKETQLSGERDANRPVCVHNVLEPDQETELIQEQLEARWEQAKDNLRFEWEGDAFTLFMVGDHPSIPGPRSLWTEEGLTKYLGYTRDFFDFEHLSVEECLSRQAQTAEQWLDRLEILAAPLVSLDDARHPDPPRIQILGTQKGPEGFFKPVAGRANWSIVENNDPHNVEVLIVYQHINWRLLNQSSSWEEAYNRRLAEESRNESGNRGQRASGDGAGQGAPSQ